MKHDIDIKITKNSEEKINEFDAKEYLEKYVKSDETNQEEKDNEDTMLKISGWAIFVMVVIVGVNFASDQGWWLKEIKHQTNVLAVLLVVLLIIYLFENKKSKQGCLSRECKNSTGNLSKDLKKGYFWQKFSSNGMSSTKSRRTELEMQKLILQTAKVLQVNAVAMSGSRKNPNAPRNEFQDYDVVYIVEDLAALVADLAWLKRFGKRVIEQHVLLDHRRLYLMLFEDGNRIDLTLCPKEHIKEWVDSEADFRVLDDPQRLFSPYAPTSKRYWTTLASETDFDKSCNEFWWVSAYVVKGIRRNHLVYATDHLYGICQQELLKLLAWQVAADKGTIDVGKNYKYLFQYLPTKKEKNFSKLLAFSDQKKITKSLLATMHFFHKEAQAFSLKTGFYYDKEIAEKMIEYAKENLRLFT